MTNPISYISIVDYGVGNTYSALKAFKLFDDHTQITDNPEKIISSYALVLPGVGAFATGIEELKKRGLMDIILQFSAINKPILGICLGAQLLMEESDEFGKHKGLGLVPGYVSSLPKGKKNAKLPHVGWNTINVATNTSNTILDGLSKKTEVYFVHSYTFYPKNSEDIMTTTKYGGVSFCSVFRHGSIYGCQFHPEKSADVGLKVIANFINIAKKNDTTK